MLYLKYFTIIILNMTTVFWLFLSSMCLFIKMEKNQLENFNLFFLSVCIFKGGSASFHKGNMFAEKPLSSKKLAGYKTTVWGLIFQEKISASLSRVFQQILFRKNWKPNLIPESISTFTPSQHIQNYYFLKYGNSRRQVR